MKMNQIVRLSTALALAVIFISPVLFTSDALAQRRHFYVDRGGPARIMALPPHHYAVMVHGQRLFYSGGYFYRHWRRGFMMVPAPIGARVRVLPFGFATFNIGLVPYYYFGGVYYRYIPDEDVYVVVQKPGEAPAATAATTPADNNDKVVLTDGTTLSGVFVGAGEDSVQFQVNGEIRSIPVTKITAINFAPSSFDTTTHK